MKSRGLLESQARHFNESFERPILSAQTLPALRATGKVTPPTIPAADLERVDISSATACSSADGTAIPVLIYQPKRKTIQRSAVLHLHGGGFVLGDAQSEADWSAWLAANLDCVVVAPDYRLAPENPHPIPVLDCYGTLEWLHESASELAIDSNRIALFGGSAGGGLAACVALMARDEGHPPIRFQCLLYPMLDDRTGTTVEVSSFVGEYIWTCEDNAFGWRALLGRTPGAGDVGSYAAAARADSLGGLPPTYLWVGALDLFCDESIQYARRLLEAGVPTELHVFPGVTHGNILVADAPSTIICRESVLRNLRAALDAQAAGLIADIRPKTHR